MSLRATNFITLILPFVLASCAGSQRTNTDFDMPLYIPEYASGFRIEGADGMESSMITIENPWQGADSVTLQLLISRNGEPIPEDFEGQVIEDDAKRIVAMSSTHVAMLDAIGSAGKVVGVSGIDFISTPDIQIRRDSVGDVGYDGNINYELLLSLDPDIVLLYGVNGSSQMEGKLKELGIPFIYLGDYLEESPLGKAEWMVAVAEITGQREKGEKIFREIPERYNNLKNKVAAATDDRPAVMLNAPYSGTWYMPSSRSYAVQLINDAGGRLVYDKDTRNASSTIDMEEAYILASEADMWINVGMAASLDELKSMAPRLTDIRCVREGKVYNNNRRTTPAGGNDYFESAVVRPDIVLRDLVKIFHPELVEDDFVYYKHLE